MDVLVAASLKTHKGILGRKSAVEYFRGVDFHVQVLKNAADIQKYLPSFKTDEGRDMPLSSIEDSIALGQAMLEYGVIKQLQADPGLQ